jgi:allantoate deiminase
MTPGLVATVGRLEVSPNVGNVVPGEVVASIDVRHQDDHVRAAAAAALRAAAERSAAARAVGISWETFMDEPAVACSPRLRSAIARAIEGVGLPAVELVSGAGHDGVQMAAITDVGMLFVRCAGGVSHHPDEAVREEDVDAAIEVMSRVLEALVGDG